MLSASYRLFPHYYYHHWLLKSHYTLTAKEYMKRNSENMRRQTLTQCNMSLPVQMHTVKEVSLDHISQPHSFALLSYTEDCL